MPATLIGNAVEVNMTDGTTRVLDVVDYQPADWSVGLFKGGWDLEAPNGDAYWILDEDDAQVYDEDGQVVGTCPVLAAELDKIDAELETALAHLEQAS